MLLRDVRPDSGMANVISDLKCQAQALTTEMKPGE
jgi:hypothetical protein